ELHPGDADIRAVHSHGSGGALEDGEARVRPQVAGDPPGRVGPGRPARGPGPRTAIDGAVVVQARVAAVPEQQVLAGGADQVDLAGRRGLDPQVVKTDARRRRTDLQPVVRQVAAVVEQPIDPGPEAAGVSDLQRSIQGQVADHVE